MLHSNQIMPVLAVNKRANFDYEILETFEAGLVLTGAEVKSIKTGHISIKEAFVTVYKDELHLTNANIPPYPQAGLITDYDPVRPRKLLIRKREFRHLVGKYHTQGLTLVPLSVYTKKRLIKLSFALAKGKKQFDKRRAINERESNRTIARAFKNAHL